MRKKKGLSFQIYFIDFRVQINNLTCNFHLIHFKLEKKCIQYMLFISVRCFCFQAMLRNIYVGIIVLLWSSYLPLLLLD